MNPLVKKVKHLGSQLDDLSLRERILVFVSATAIAYLLWQLVLYDNVIASTKKIAEATGKVNQQLAAINKEAELMQKIFSVNPDEDTKNKLAKLKKILSKQEHNIHDLSSPFIRPEKLSVVLESIVNQDSALQLISLQTMPPEPLAVENDKGDKVNAEANKPGEMAEGLFKHAVRLHLRGGYKQTYDYISALEGLPWHFYWQSMEYVVTSYPEADVFLEVYTISTGKGVFGV